MAKQNLYLVQRLGGAVSPQMLQPSKGLNQITKRMDLISFAFTVKPMDTGRNFELYWEKPN